MIEGMNERFWKIKSQLYYIEIYVYLQTHSIIYLRI